MIMNQSFYIGRTILQIISCSILFLGACSKNNNAINRGTTFDTSSIAHIPLVDEMPDIPVNYHLIDWNQRAKDFDSFIFDGTKSGQYLPIIKTDNTNKTFKMPAYVGINLQDGAEEAVANMQAVLGASLAGIDKSNQNGMDYVTQIQVYKNRENVITNNPNQLSAGLEFWYALLPTVEFGALTDLYAKVPGMRDIMKTVADRWYEAVVSLGGSNVNFSHTGYDFATMKPFDRRYGNGGAWIEPDAAAGVGIFLYWAYQAFHDGKYLDGASWCANFLANLPFAPSYETLIIWGPLLGARLNAEQAQKHNIAKLMAQVFNESSDARQGWGMRVGTWGGYGADGLIGAKDNSDGYAFAMNSFLAPMGIAPVARYDQRFARDIGKWILNVASNARLFYADQLPATNQEPVVWSGDPEHVIPYEGLRNFYMNQSPYATGDPTHYGWGPTDFGIYSGAPSGVLGGIIRSTDVDKILQIDILKTDFFHAAAYPSYLYFNPYRESKTVTIDGSNKTYDLYDAVTDNYLKTGVTGSTTFSIPALGAVVLVLVPANGKRVHNSNGTIVIDNVFVAFRTK
ncbi:MAG: hypothetical protein ABJA57_01910 [Ginsengibacter sp.]